MIPIPALLPLLKNKYLLAGVVGAAAIIGVWWWHTAKVSSAAEDAYARGMKDERLVWQVRLVEEVTAANAKYAELQEKYRALEKKSVDDIEVITNGVNIELKRLRNERDKALADARDGMDFRLRWAATCAPTPRVDSGRSSTATPGADPGSAGRTAVCELPRETTEDLIRLASEADRVVAERNALLEVARKDREVCR